MYEGLRLTELHEEWANARERAARYKNLDRAYSQIGAELEAESYEAEIRARVAAQEIDFPYLPMSRTQAHEYQIPLLYAVPDAERVYPAKRRGIPLMIRNGAGEEVEAPEWMVRLEWTHHARHAVPVEGCHLCHPQPSRWTPGGFVHEEHIPCE